MTYDRKINKMGVENVFKANHNIIPPSLVSPVRIFTDNFVAELKNYRPGGIIFYTTDGTEPTVNSSRYSEPFKLSEACTIKAFTKWEDAQSHVASFKIEKKNVISSAEVSKPKPGIKTTIYDGEFAVLPDFSALKPLRTKTVQQVSHSVATKDSFFAIVFEGYILIPADGVFGLFINSDDGSKMVLDETETVINDGIHGMREEGNYYPLSKGYHKIKIEYFQREGGVGLEFLVEAPGQKKSVVPAGWLFN